MTIINYANGRQTTNQQINSNTLSQPHSREVTLSHKAKGSEQAYLLRAPDASDAAEIFDLLRAYRPYVGNNPMYTYLIICEHHADTSVVATNEEGEIVGFISAYLVPDRPDTLFIWEVGVHENNHGYRLSLHMMLELCRRTKPSYVEATVNPSNGPSSRRFQELAKEYDSLCKTRTIFPASYFKPQAHEDEVLYTIGPIKNPEPINATKQ